MKPRELEQVLRLEYRSKLLNPKWAQASPAHDMHASHNAFIVTWVPLQAPQPQVGPGEPHDTCSAVIVKAIALLGGIVRRHVQVQGHVVVAGQSAVGCRQQSLTLVAGLLACSLSGNWAVNLCSRSANWHSCWRSLGADAEMDAL